MSTLTLQSLPLFPLGTVLFPGGALPLRVFEVRYLDMVGRCQRAGAPFGVVALTAGQEVRAAGAPAEQLAREGTLAHITHLDQPQPGLLLIECRGAERFHIDRQQQLTHGLWVADVTLQAADAAVGVPEDLRHVSQALQRVRQQLRHAPQRSTRPDADGDAAGDAFDDCGWVANRWCELLPLPLELKQNLMRLDNPLLRLELVADLLDRTGIDRVSP